MMTESERFNVELLQLAFAKCQERADKAEAEVERLRKKLEDWE